MELFLFCKVLSLNANNFITVVYQISFLFFPLFITALFISDEKQKKIKRSGAAADMKNCMENATSYSYFRMTKMTVAVVVYFWLQGWHIYLFIIEILQTHSHIDRLVGTTTYDKKYVVYKRCFNVQELLDVKVV